MRDHSDDKKILRSNRLSGAKGNAQLNRWRPRSVGIRHRL